MIVKRLDWDSAFFGIRIGKADVLTGEEMTVLQREKGQLKEQFDLLYVFADHHLGLTLLGGRLVDKKVVYSSSCSIESNPSPQIVEWDEDRGVTDDLLHLALVSGKYSRFKIDKRLPQGSYERLYSRWIEQSVNHQMATEVFCYMVNNRPVGLVTLDNTNGIATIGLVAIHEDFQKRGIGSAMMRHVNDYAESHHCASLSVATQLDNRPACKLYEKSGFQVESVTDVWHWWM